MSAPCILIAGLVLWAFAFGVVIGHCFAMTDLAYEQEDRS